MLGPGAVLGHFEVVKVLGRGATATVYEALDVAVERRVALKVLSPELGADPAFSDRFRREARLQASLDNAHIATVYEAAESELGFYIAMRLIEGPTLATLIARRALDAQRALEVLADVATALDAAHVAGLVHRDVKPQNVLVDPSGAAYLTDFGLTKVTLDSGLTTTGGIVGTVAYIAPEVIHGSHAGPAADRYAFGAMLFESLTGRPVFDRGTEAAMLYAHTSEPPPAVSEVRPELPAELNAIVAAALAKDPDQRPSSACGLIAAVRAALSPHLGTLEPPPVRAIRARDGTRVPITTGRPSLRRRGATTLAAGSILGAGAAVAVLAVAGLLSPASRSSRPRVAPLPGAVTLGAQLSTSGLPVGCPGGPVRACTFMQAALSGRSLSLNRAGVIRRWSVRDARGELALQVLSWRGGHLQQVERSQSVYVPDERVHTFATDLRLERGEFAGVEPIAGASVGVQSGVGGARLLRWSAPVGGSATSAARAATLTDRRLLLELDVLPGAGVSQPAASFGPAAEGLDSGIRLARRAFRFRDGLAGRLELDAVQDGIVLDEFRAGRRVARITVPGMLPGGRVITFLVDRSPPDATEVGVYIEYVNADSQLLVSHYFLVHPSDLVYVD